MNRRDFVRGSSATAALTLFGCAPSIPLITSSTAGGVLRIPVSTPALVAVGGMVRVDPQTGSAPILIRRVSESRYEAMSMECMHLGCTVRIEGATLRCPCHGSAYDLDGRLLNGPAQLPLDTYDVFQEGEELVLRNGES